MIREATSPKASSLRGWLDLPWTAWPTGSTRWPALGPGESTSLGWRPWRRTSGWTRRNSRRSGMRSKIRPGCSTRWVQPSPRSRSAGATSWPRSSGSSPRPSRSQPRRSRAAGAVRVEVIGTVDAARGAVVIIANLAERTFPRPGSVPLDPAHVQRTRRPRSPPTRTSTPLTPIRSHPAHRPELCPRAAPVHPGDRRGRRVADAGLSDHRRQRRGSAPGRASSTRSSVASTRAAGVVAHLHPVRSGAPGARGTRRGRGGRPGPGGGAGLRGRCRPAAPAGGRPRSCRGSPRGGRSVPGRPLPGASGSTSTPTTAGCWIRTPSTRIAEAFGPEHTFSPSQLESYAFCPFQFFQQVRPGPEVGRRWRGTCRRLRRRGKDVHRVLEEVHLAMLAEETTDLAARLPILIETKMTAELDRSTARRPPGEADVAEVLREINTLRSGKALAATSPSSRPTRQGRAPRRCRTGSRSRSARTTRPNRSTYLILGEGRPGDPPARGDRPDRPDRRRRGDPVPRDRLQDRVEPQRRRRPSRAWRRSCRSTRWRSSGWCLPAGSSPFSTPGTGACPRTGSRGSSSAPGTTTATGWSASSWRWSASCGVGSFPVFSQDAKCTRCATSTRPAASREVRSARKAWNDRPSLEVVKP